MKEKDFNTEIVRTGKRLNYFAYKLGDMVPGGGSRFIPEKPCDIIMCSKKGRFIAIESKQIKKWQSLKKSMLRENQITALNKVVKNNGLAFLFLNVRISRSKGQPSQNWCVIFNWAKHGENILSNKYTVDLLKSQKVGVWRSPFKDEENKIVWDLKGLTKL